MEKNLSKLSASKIAGIVTGANFDGIDPAILEAAKQRGLLIHDDIEHGTFQTDEGKWIKKQINGRVGLFEQGGQIETQFGLVTGRYDLEFCEDPELIDFKTQATPDLRYWTVQLNIYRALVKNRVERLKVYHIPKTGNYKVFDIPVLTQEKLDTIIETAFKGEVLPDEFWGFIEKSSAEEINFDLVVYNHDVGKLETNVDAIIEMISKKIKSYVPENYSPENVDIAKKDKAALNKSASFLNDKRIELEKRHMEPIVKITEKIKSAKKMIEDASAKIDVIVKEVETKEKDTVKKELTEYFNSLPTSALIKFDQIFNPAMLNKTAKRNETKKAIADKVEKVKLDLVILDRIDCPEAKAYYLQYLDLDSALREADKIKELRERLDKAKEQTEKKPEAVEEKPIVLNVKAGNNLPLGIAVRDAIANSYTLKETFSGVNAFDVIEHQKSMETEEEIFTRKFEVKGTKEQLNYLADVMNEKGIQWDPIKEEDL